MVGRRVGPTKIYPIQSILLVPIYIILGFHGDRSNRTRYILFGPPLGPLLALWWAGVWAHRKCTPSNRFYLFQYTLFWFFMEIGPTGQDISSPAHLSDHSWPNGGPEGRRTEDIPHPIDLTCSNIHYSQFSWR